MSVDVPSLKEYPQNFKSHKEMLVFVHHMMSVQYPQNFNKGMQILTMLQIEANRSKNVE